MNATHGIPTKALLAALASVTLIAGAAAAATQKVKVIKLAGDASPGSVASAYGSIWVASHSGLGVYRFDPRTNRLLKWIRVGENQCVDLTAGAGAMWVWNCSGETGSGLVYEISARTDRVVRRLNGMYGTFGDGSLWTQSEDWTKVLRVDPRSGLTVARIPLPIPVPATGHVFPAAVCYGSLWSVADTTVIRYDTATNKVAAVIPLPGSVSASSGHGGWFDANYAACSANKVFVPNLAGLYSVNPSTNTATKLPVPMKPNSAVGDPGVTSRGRYVYVRSSDTTVSQVDAERGIVVHRYPAGGGGGEQIAVAFGSVWIPAAAGHSVWREPTRAP